MLNNVSFRAGALDSARDIMDQPQKYAKQPGVKGAPTGPESDTFVKPKKKHSVRNVILGTLATAAVVIGGLVAGNKLGWFNKLIDKAGATDAKKVTKFMGAAAEKLNVAGEWLATKGTNAWKAVTGMFSKGAKKETVA